MEIDAPTHLSGRGQSFLGCKALTPSLAPGPEKPFGEGVNNSSTMAGTIADFCPRISNTCRHLFLLILQHQCFLIWLAAY